MRFPQIYFTRSKGLLAIALILFSSFIVSVVFQIPVARQILGFLYLTIVPGLLLIEVLGENKLDATETLVLSIGLSLVFLMVVGLVVNAGGPLFGILAPLSEVPLMVGLNTAILALCLFVYFKGGRSEFPALGPIKIKPVSVIFFSLPVMAVIGTYLVNLSATDNLVLIAMIIAIAVLWGFSLLDRFVPSNLYPLILVASALALLFHTSLISGHLNGYDVQYEYLFMRTTVASSQWIPNIYDKFQVLMTVTILPATYWNILGLNGVWIEKILYPSIFAFVPVVLYKLFGVWLDKKTSFLAAIFFIASAEFFTEMLSLGRQMIAEFFFALLLYIIFTKKINERTKLICFTFFSFGLIASHYALAYIFLFIIWASWLVRLVTLKKKTISIRNVQFSFVIIFSVLIFSWYIYVSSEAAFNTLTSVFNSVKGGVLNDFFDPNSRTSSVLLGVGVGATQTSSFINTLGRFWAYAAELLVVLGFVFIFIKRKKRIFDIEYIAIIFMSIMLLVLSIALPNFVGNLGMTRLYHIALISLAPLCILSIEAISSLVSKKRKKVICIIICFVFLVPFLLFQTGAVYEIAKVQNYSFPLSLYRFNADEYNTLGIIDDKDISGIQWLSANYNENITTVYAAPIQRSLIVTGGYGMIPLSNTVDLASNNMPIRQQGIIYLALYNTHYNDMSGYSTSDYVNSTLNSKDSVYSNAGCEIYFNP